jgi:hypothetical protein
MLSLNDVTSDNAGTLPVDEVSTEQKLQRVLTLAEELSEQCRICWFRGEVQRPHATYRCPTGVCSGDEWKSFKKNAYFPGRTVCFLCFASFAPPFNHEVPPPGSRYSGELCEYPDVLKELAYIIYQDRTARSIVFTKLGVPTPTTLASYKRFIGRKHAGGILGLYEAISAYLCWREEERPLLSN